MPAPSRCRRALPPPADDRHAGGAVVGRRRRAERPGPRPPPGRIARSRRSRARRSRRRSTSSASRRSSSPGSRARRSRPRSSGSGRRPGRDVGPGHGRDPEPDPPRRRTPRPRRSSPASSRRSAIPMRATAHRFLPGHRIRLSVASSYWPVIWPSPFRAEYGLHLGGRRRTVAAHPADPAGRRRRAPGPAVQDDAGRPARDRLVDRTSRRRGGSPTTSSTARVTVTSSEFGEVVLPDGTDHASTPASGSR